MRAGGWHGLLPGPIKLDANESHLPLRMILKCE
jgi:hypothetical protein